MTIELFEVEDKKQNFSFFSKIFLLTNLTIDVFLDMPFFILSNVNKKFIELSFF